jgi:hypothetical protein
MSSCFHVIRLFLMQIGLPVMEPTKILPDETKATAVIREANDDLQTITKKNARKQKEMKKHVEHIEKLVKELYRKHGDINRMSKSDQLTLTNLMKQRQLDLDSIAIMQEQDHSMNTFVHNVDVAAHMTLQQDTINKALKKIDRIGLTNVPKAMKQTEKSSKIMDNIKIVVSQLNEHAQKSARENSNENEVAEPDLLPFEADLRELKLQVDQEMEKKIHDNMADAPLPRSRKSQPYHHSNNISETRAMNGIMNILKENNINHHSIELGTPERSHNSNSSNSDQQEEHEQKQYYQDSSETENDEYHDRVLRNAYGHH